MLTTNTKNTMKRVLTLLSLTSLIVLAVHGETIDVDSLRYTLNSDGTATLTTCLYTKTPEIVIPSTVSDGTQDYTVTKIGQNAFDGRRFITSVTFPETLEYMDYCSFRYCSGLTAVNIPASLKELSSSNFSQCTSLQTVTIAAGSQMTKVDEAAFYNCNKLTSINLPSTVTEIGTSAFIYCSSLTTIDLPASLTSIGEFAFYYCSKLDGITIPASVTTIGSYAFAECSSMTDITIPPKVATIGNYAFYGCNGLTAIEIPASVTSLGEYVFSHCKNLTSATLQEGITTLPRDLFSECTKLASVTIPQTITSVKRGVFYQCTALGSITLPAGVTEIGDYAFYGTPITTINIPSQVASIGDYAFYDCSNLTTMDIPNSVTTIGRYAFRGCKQMESIHLPTGLTKISDYLLYDCLSLTSLTLPDGITEIGNSAFHNCKLLTSLIIPSGVTTLGQSVFEDCIGLTEVTLPNSVTSIGNYLFQRCRALTGITLPNNLSTISYAMFNGCTSLAAIEIPASVTKIESYAFEECTALKEVVIPSGVTSIGDGVFKNCTSLEKATLSDYITQLPRDIFYGCTSLSSFNFPAQLTTIGSSAFYKSTALQGDVVLPQSVKVIKNNAFQDCDRMKSITFSEELTTLEYEALYGCDSLQTIVFPKHLKTIPRNLCGYCRQLQSIVFPEDVETIEGYAFQYCGVKGTLTLPATLKTVKDHAFYRMEMQHIAFPEGIQTIGNSSFQSCESLLDVTLPASLTRLEGYAFDDCDNLFAVVFPDDATNLTFSGDHHFATNKQLRSVTLPKTGMTTIPQAMFGECDRLRNIELPATLTSIGAQVFYGCDSLQTIYIPDGVTAIGDEAFDYCTKLKYARLPEGLQTIGIGCFAWNENLQYLNIPSTVTSIGNYALHTTGTVSNMNFKSLGIMATTMPSTGEHVFYYLQPAVTLLVPEGEEDSYQNSASWTPHGTDNRTIKGYSAEKQTLTQDLIHLSCLDKETYLNGGPEAVYVDWFEGMGNYRVYYTDAKGNKTTTMPTKGGSYTISLEFEEGPYYKPATFNDIATFNVQEIADEDFALLWDFYSKTYDPTGAKSTWTGSGGGGAPANWKLVKGHKESAVGIFAVKWKGGHVEEINMGTGTSIYNLNANETPVSLFALPKVKKIEFANAEFYGNISDKVEEWLASGKTLSPTLEYLDLQRNKLEGNIATLANALPALKTLDVHENYFSAVYPALSETLENVNISSQTIPDNLVSTVDLGNMTEAGFFSTLPSIVFYDPATRTYADDISITLVDPKNGYNLNINYEGSEDYTVSGSGTWKSLSGTRVQARYTDSSNKTTTFRADFLFSQGDVDFNNAVNVSDLQQSINYLFRESYYPNSRYNFAAGDLVADNSINVLDIVKHVDLLLSQELAPAGSRPALTRQPVQSLPEASLYLQKGCLVLNASRPVAALDIMLEASDDSQFSALSAQLPSGMTSSRKIMADGQLHLVIYSLSGKTIPAGVTTIASGICDSSVSNAALVDGEARQLSVRLNDASAVVTAVQGVTTLNGRDAVYDLQGRRWSDGPLPKGVYIINGKKVAIK